MGTCLSKKQGSSTSLPQTKSATPTTTTSVEFQWKKGSSQNGINKPKDEIQPEVKLQVQKHDFSVKQHKGSVKKEIFIIKHRKSHDERDTDSMFKGKSDDSIEETELMGMRTSSCTKEDVDAILLHCGRLSRNSSGKGSSFGEHRRRFSGSKKSFDFDTILSEKDQKISDLQEGDWNEPVEKLNLQSQSPRSLSQDRNRNRRRRRTPSREREKQQCSSSTERRFSISPVRRSSDSITQLNGRNNTSTSSMPAKMVSVPATVSSIVMNKSNKSNNSGCGESAAASTGIKRIEVRRNVGAASPRSQSPARADVTAANQKQNLSFSRNSSRRLEVSPHRRNPLSEIEPNIIAISHSTNDNDSSSVHSKPRMEIEREANKKPNASRIALDKGMDMNCKTKLQQDEDVKEMSSMTDNVVVKTVVQSGDDEALTRSRSLRRLRGLELDLSPEAQLIPPRSYTSLLLEDIHNFHQKNTTTPPVVLPACVTRACSILEAVANLNSNISSNISGVEDKRNPPSFQSIRNEYNIPLGSSNSNGKKVANTKDPVDESELIVYDDMVEPRLHKYETSLNKGCSDLEEQESSQSNSLTVRGMKQQRDISPSWKPSSIDSKDCWTSRSNNSREKARKSQLGLEGRESSLAGRANMDGTKKKLNIRSECDHQHDNETGRGRLGANNVLHMKPVVNVITAAST